MAKYKQPNRKRVHVWNKVDDSEVFVPFAEDFKEITLDALSRMVICLYDKETIKQIVALRKELSEIVNVRLAFYRIKNPKFDDAKWVNENKNAVKTVMKFITPEDEWTKLKDIFKQVDIKDKTELIKLLKDEKFSEELKEKQYILREEILQLMQDVVYKRIPYLDHSFRLGQLEQLIKQLTDLKDRIDNGHDIRKCNDIVDRINKIIAVINSVDTQEETICGLELSSPCDIEKFKAVILEKIHYLESCIQHENKCISEDHKLLQEDRLELFQMLIKEAYVAQGKARGQKITEDEVDPDEVLSELWDTVESLVENHERISSSIFLRRYTKAFYPKMVSEAIQFYVQYRPYEFDGLTDKEKWQTINAKFDVICEQFILNCGDKVGQIINESLDEVYSMTVDEIIKDLAKNQIQKILDRSKKSDTMLSIDDEELPPHYIESHSAPHLDDYTFMKDAGDKEREYDKLPKKFFDKNSTETVYDMYISGEYPILEEKIDALIDSLLVRSTKRDSVQLWINIFIEKYLKETNKYDYEIARQLGTSKENFSKRLPKIENSAYQMYKAGILGREHENFAVQNPEIERIRRRKAREQKAQEKKSSSEATSVSQTEETTAQVTSEE